MSIYGKCPTCGGETKDYLCASCLVTERDDLRRRLEAAYAAAAERESAWFVGVWSDQLAKQALDALDAQCEPVLREEHDRLWRDYDVLSDAGIQRFNKVTTALAAVSARLNLKNQMNLKPKE